MFYDEVVDKFLRVSAEEESGGGPHPTHPWYTNCHTHSLLLSDIHHASTSRLVCCVPAGLSPGYGNEVIFADGTFIDGSTLELSADGPLREPFVAFTQVHLIMTFQLMSIRNYLV